MKSAHIKPSSQLANVRYEIRGPLARRAAELEKAGHEIIKLNIGNPGAFGFRAPETMRQAMIENLRESDAYCHQKGIFPAREAVVMQQQNRGVMNTTADDVFMGNGVSELILFSLRALLNEGDEVLVPSPDYPLWTAATHLNDGKAVHYPCRRSSAGCPTSTPWRKLITPRTRAMVIISPNNPTGAVYPREVLQEMVHIAEEHELVVFTDEIYDQITYDGAEYTPGGDAGQAHPVRHLRRSLQGLPLVRLSRGLAQLLGREGPRRASTCSASTPSCRCACARTWSASGRCRPRSAATSPSTI